jgi:hypothetical protein
LHLRVGALEYLGFSLEFGLQVGKIALQAADQLVVLHLGKTVVTGAAQLGINRFFVDTVDLCIGIGFV